MSKKIILGIFPLSLLSLRIQTSSSFFKFKFLSYSSTRMIKKPLDRDFDLIADDIYQVKIENKEFVRYVRPYFQDFKTHAKGRWLGREVLEVVTREFGAMKEEYWKHAIQNGFVRVNGQIIPPSYRFKNNDFFTHRKHR